MTATNHGPGPSDPGRFLDRDLSTLAYIGRVLAIANDGALPVLERVRFLAIVSQAVDDFFQVRVPELRRRASHRSPARCELELVRSHVEAIIRDQDRLLRGTLLPRLAGQGCDVVRWSLLERHEAHVLREQFEHHIVPLLTPMPLGGDSPAPSVPNLALCLLVSTHEKTGSGQAIVPVPAVLPRLFVLAGGRAVRIEDIIHAHRNELRDHLGWTDIRTFRVTRSAELFLDSPVAGDEVELCLDVRPAGEPARLEVQPTMPNRVRDRLARQLGLTKHDVYDLVPLIDAGSLSALHAIDRPELRAPRLRPTIPSRLAGGDVFAAMQQGDVLVHHPYESFDASVLALLNQAANDPDVVSIRQTLYRTSEDSPVVFALADAARAGKRVDVVVEVKARFDERANLAWARLLRGAGANVVTGVRGLKVHAKALVVTRREDGALRSYAHIGTGNYDPSTARLYEDLSILTADPAVNEEAHAMFDAILDQEVPNPSAEAALIAPTQLRDELIELIEAERHAPAESRQIIMKLNNLVDAEVIDALYAASGDGVEIDLIVRSSCCLRPGVPGLSDHIRVRSVAGRILEHSRIFVFGAGDRARWFVGSADLMPRNLDRRVELVVPVRDETIKERLREVLVAAMLDDTRGWELRGDGSWHRTPRRIGLDLQETLAAAARARIDADSGPVSA